MKIRRGHRRTQSDIVQIMQIPSKHIRQASSGVSSMQITKLLNICNQKAKQKVSNVEVLSPPNQNSYLVFQFGQNSHKKSIQLTQNDESGDYLACIPQRKQSTHQDCDETIIYSMKTAQINERKADEGFQQKFRRLPFSDAVNNKPRERRKAQPEKNRQLRKEIRNRLGLKVKF